MESAIITPICILRIFHGLDSNYVCILNSLCFLNLYFIFADIWSLGVILFMLVCGQPPFQEANDSETLTMIMDCKYTVPPHVSKECKE